MEYGDPSLAKVLNVPAPAARKPRSVALVIHKRLRGGIALAESSRPRESAWNGPPMNCRLAWS